MLDKVNDKSYLISVAVVLFFLTIKARQLFRYFDIDKNGAIDKNEFQLLLSNKSEMDP